MTVSRSKRFIPAIAILILTLVCFGTAMAADVILVANPKVTESSLSGEQLKGMFLGRLKAWPSGAKAEIVVLKEHSDVHEAFLSKYIGRSPVQFNTSWKQLVFTGKGRMPREFATEGKLIEYVSQTEGAIGYISSGSAKGSTKIISVK